MNFPLRGDYFRRAGWFLLAMLFVLTGLGVGVYAFWINTHPGNSNSANTAQTQASCSSDLVDNEPALPNPDVYKPAEPVQSLQTTDLQNGGGPAAKSGDCLIVKYYGTLASNGTFFDGDFDTSQGFKFQLGAQQVIPGWDQGLVGMKAGGTRRVAIPSALAYGSQSPSPTIPANSDLVFVVKLLKLN